MGPSPRVHAELREARGVQVGRERVARPMHKLQIEGVSRRGTRRRTTTADPAAVRRPTGSSAASPRRRRIGSGVADLTYVPTYEGWLFARRAGVTAAHPARSARRL